jgi:hypothetical protein
LFASLGLRVTRSSIGYPLLLVALDHYYDTPLEVAVVAPLELGETGPLAGPLRKTFVPNKAFAILTDTEAAEQQSQVPWLEGKRAMGGKATAYVCERGRCDLPTSSPSVFQKQIDRRKPYPSFAKAPPPRLPFERVK